MTYCLAIQFNAGLVFCSDSRTNAGPDQVSSYRKMHKFFIENDRALVLLTSGNLATSQAVVSHLGRDLRDKKSFNIAKARDVSEIAEYIGELSASEQKKYSKVGGPDAETFDATSTFILGGQIGAAKSELYLIYPEGNHITAPEEHPFLQIGETKYGKPILDRIIGPEISPDTAMTCAILSLDSTMRSNATVGPPIECLFYREHSLNLDENYCRLEEGHPYLIEIRQDWDRSILSAVERLPSLSALLGGEK